ncbi:MAG: YbaN family protein [bacterium]
MEPHNVDINNNSLIRAILFFCGLLFLCLGIVGIFVPLLPTTPFLLLSIALFARSSKRLYHWLIDNKYIGKYLKNYIEKKGLPLKVKIITIAILFASILFSIIFVIDSKIIKIVLFTVAIIVSIHISLIPNTKEQEDLTLSENNT